jgi:F-type H+-transporting ATPase subunit b
MRYVAQVAEEVPNPIVPIIPEMIIGAIAFGLLCFVLMKFVFPRMNQMYEARVEAIEGGLQRAEKAQAEANELLAQYKAQLAEARTEAARIRDEARADAEGIRRMCWARPVRSPSGSSPRARTLGR